MIEVSRLKDLNAAKLFLGFRIGAISRRDFAVFPVQGQRGLRRLKRYFGDKMSVGAQMVVILKAFVERCVSLVLGHPFEFSWLDVSQADVFHQFLLCLYTSGCDRAGTLVIHNDDAIRADYAFRHLEGRRDRAIRKQPLSSAQRERIYHQPEHIDQIMLDKRLKEIATPPNV